MLERTVPKDAYANRFPNVLTLSGEIACPSDLSSYSESERDLFYQEIEKARESLDPLVRDAPQNFSLILWNSKGTEAGEAEASLQGNHKTNLLVIPSDEDFFSWAKLPAFCSELSQMCGSLSFCLAKAFLESFLYSSSLANAICKNRNLVLRNHMFSPGRWLIWQNFTFVNFKTKSGWNECFQSTVESEKDKEFNRKYNSKLHIATFATKDAAIERCMNKETTIVDALPEFVQNKEEVHLFLPVYVIKDLAKEDVAEIWSPQAVYIDDSDQFRLAMGKSDNLAPMQVALNA